MQLKMPLKRHIKSSAKSHKKSMKKRITIKALYPDMVELPRNYDDEIMEGRK